MEVSNSTKNLLQSRLSSCFRRMDTWNIGMLPLQDFQSILVMHGESKPSGFSTEQVLDLIHKSGAGLVRYDSFLDWVFSSCDQNTELTHTKVERSTTPGKPDAAEISALKARIVELEQKAKESATIKESVTRPNSVVLPDQVSSDPQNKGAQAQYDVAFEQIGGEEALRACRLQSMQISNLIDKRPGLKAWEQDSVYLGLHPNVLMRDSELVYEKFTAACAFFKKTLQKEGLQTEVLLGPRKGIVRCQTKINVKYGGDVCQLSDITRATLQIKAYGKETLANTYKAMLKMVTFLPGNVEITHFDDRFARPMLGGYRDFLFLISVRGILCEVQLNFDTIMKVKDGEGHEEYEVVRLSNDLMMDAAQMNDSSSVKQHLRKKADPNYRTARNFNALSYAAMHGNRDMCKWLISYKANPFQVDCTGILAVTRAVKLGKLQAAEVIISAMSECARDMSQPLVLTAHARMDIILTWVSLKNSADVLKKGLLVGFDEIFDRASGGEDAALCMTAQAGLAKACETLIQAKAQVNAWSFCSDVRGNKTPLDYAVEGGSAATVKVLLDHGAECRQYAPGDNEYGAIDLFKELKENALKDDLAAQIDALIEASHSQPWAISLPDLLIAAAESRAVDTATKVLRRMTEGLQVKQISGFTAKLTADLVLRGINQDNLQDNLELITLLMSHDADFSLCSGVVHAAAENGKIGIISLCAEAGFPMEDMNSNGELPVHLAARAGHTDLVKALHKMGYSIERPSGMPADCDCDAEPTDPSPKAKRTSLIADKLNKQIKKVKYIPMTPAHLAAENGHTELLFALRDIGCDLPACRTSGPQWYLLHVAVAGNQAETIRALLALRCDIDCRDAKGGTPVHHAVRGCRTDVLRTLADSNADVNAAYPSKGTQDWKAGCTAAHLAASLDHISVLHTLVKLRADFTLQNAAGKTPLELATSDAARLILRNISS
eukprot:gnl/MRDRNA2_/MRDRNA2_64247_c0_seq1.p1 gnl/MRDRNA2_/MRDRNA2_64247_c0~~gnl/MRDRNA2_/MRDRNA2_64247_c0_seq1.p1  ORF type:complete len:950 (-),score=191.21 gnl/MRDRNA2_/MRDRNA2_64247_c0_seq1:290-3139(-)